MRILAATFLGGLIGLSQAVFAQVSTKDRILEAVDVSRAATVSGNVHPMARAEFDQGKVEASMPMRLTITFKMTAAQEADLNALLAAQQDRGSPDYHRWLTPEQFGGRFGLGQSDIDKVSAWLEGEGFRAEGVPPSRNMITFTGSAQQVESALHTEIHRYVVNGKRQYANASDPSVPAAVADVVQGFRGLNDFQLKPRPLKKEVPKFSSGISGNHFITPPDFVTIYHIAPLYKEGLHGENQKIAVVGQSNISLSDVQAFRSNSGLTAVSTRGSCPGADCPVQVVIVPNETDPGMVSGDIDEASLDVEWAGAIAYNASVIFVVGNKADGGVLDAMNYAITANLAPVISTSYGACEPDFSSSEISSMQALFQQANAQGITVLAPTGDTGAADCDSNANPKSPVTVSTMGLAVDLPAAFPQVTSVGGTKFSEGADAAGTYWNNPACLTPALNACSSATASEDITPGSAKSYILEGAWNDTDVTPQGASTSTGLSAGGGGASASIPKPAWQTGTGVPNDGARDVPDISLSASPLHDAYLICSEDVNSSANPPTFSPTCVNGFRRNNAQMTLAAVGGTSVGPPAMAGIVALINQATNHGQGSGNINPVLYPLAAHSPSAFHDITSGSNMVPFSPPCVASTQIGYSASTGYDLATGLGSIDAANLVNNWSSVAAASTANAASSVDFSIAFAQAQITITRGSCGSGTLALTRLNGFAGTPRFTCTVAATLGSATCAVVPAATGGFDPPANFKELRWWGIFGVAMALGLVSLSLAAFETTKRQRLRFAFAAAFTVFAFAIMGGCGRSSNSNSNNAGDSHIDYMFAVQVPSSAPVATGTASVSASIGGISHSAQITLTTQ